MKILKCAMALLYVAFFAPQAMACFVVYNPANQVVYSDMSPPIDMSYQIHQRLPAAFPGGHMVFGDSTDCSAIDARKASPALTGVPMASAAVSARPSSKTSRAARNREADALTK